MGQKFTSIIFKLIIQRSSSSTFYEISVRWTLENLINEKSPLVQVMACCRHCLSRCWPRSMLPYGDNELNPFLSMTLWWQWSMANSVISCRKSSTKPLNKPWFIHPKYFQYVWLSYPFFPVLKYIKGREGRSSQLCLSDLFVQITVEQPRPPHCVILAWACCCWSHDYLAELALCFKAISSQDIDYVW